MKYGELNLWIDVLQFLLTIGLAIYVWNSNRHRVTVDRIQNLEALFEQGLAADRLSRIEDALGRMPKTEDMAGVCKRLDGLQGDLRELSGKLEGLAKTQTLVMQQMMEAHRP